MDCEPSTLSSLEAVLPILQPSAPTTLSSLCRIYDTLLDALWKDQEDKAIIEGNTIAVRRQADYLQALQMTCRFIAGILDLHPPSTATSQPVPAIHGGSNQSKTSRPKQQLLEQTMKRCELLLQVLQDKVGDMPPSDSEILERSFEEIHVSPLKDHEGLYTFTFTKDKEDSDDGDNILTFDRKVLEEEEGTLLEMANTPIPGEGEGEGEEANAMDCQQEDVTLQTELQTEWSVKVYEDCQERRKRQRVE